MQRSRRSNDRRRGNTSGQRQQTNRSANTPRRAGVQNASKFDGQPVTRSVNLYSKIQCNDSVDRIAYGLGNIFQLANAPDQPYLTEIINAHKSLFEQYRIRRVRVFANPGANFTNDIRIKTQVAARVDVDRLPNTATPLSLGQLLSSTNTKIKTLRADAPLLLCDYNPRCYHEEQTAGADSTQRVLPLNAQWHTLSDIWHQKWKGCTVALLTPDEQYLPSTAPTISLRIRCDIQFRGRITDGAAFHSSLITLPTPVPLDGATFDVRALARTYTVVSHVQDISVTVSYSGATPNETLTWAGFAAVVTSLLWLGDPVTNWTGPTPI